MLAVRAFEAAARHGSFVRAAAELFVSAGAVGHQVRVLEEWLGGDLFTRLPRSVELTDMGRRYYLDVRAVLEELERASLAVRRAQDDEELTVTAMPSFVTRWLMPRLGDFRAQHPSVEVRLLASVPPVDFARDRVDLAIRLGPGPYPGVVAEPLMAEVFYAVAQPQLCAAIRSKEEVLQHTLLHDEYEPRIPEQVDWTRWCAAQEMKVPARRLRQGLRFSHTYLALDAAAAGQGVAVASHVLCGDALRSGALARVPARPVAGPYRYHMLLPRGGGARPAVSAFCDWLRTEAALSSETEEARSA